MRTYPVFLILEGATVLVVGGGEVAARKIEALLEAGAEIVVVASEVSEEILDMPVTVEKRPYQSGEAAVYALTVAATNDNDTNRMIADDARGAGRLVNVVDVPELCNFIVPAVIRRGEMIVAIGTGGAGPIVSRRIRERLEKQLSDRIGPLVELLGDFRRGLRSRFKDIDERKSILEEATSPELIDSYLDGNEGPLKEFLSRWI